MKLTFVKTTELELCDINEQGEITGTSTDTVAQGISDQVELLSEEEDAFNVIFEDGKVASVPKNSVEVEMEEDDVALLVVNSQVPVDLVNDDTDEAAAALTQHQQPEQ